VRETYSTQELSIIKTVLGGDPTNTWEIGFPNATDITATLDNNTLTISGTGAMQNWGPEMPWYCIKDEITSVVVENDITSIGNSAFRFLRNLLSVSIPNTVVRIGNEAFSFCALTSIIIPNSVADIGDWAFDNCNNLTSITSEAIIPPILHFPGSVFRGVNSVIPVYVPCGTIATYQLAEGWSSFTNYQSHSY
jgi:hypothetical protein